MTDLEQLFSAASRLAEERHPATGDPLRLLARARQARRRRRLAVMSVPAVTAVGVAALVVPRSLPVRDPAPGVLAAPGPAECEYREGDPDRPRLDPSASPQHVVEVGPSGRPAPASPRNVGPPPATPADLPATATVRTSLGVLTLDLLGAQDEAPCAVNSFMHLARSGFYDGTDCHRVTTEGIFVLQCGDPTGTGTGGPGYRFDSENLDGATYEAGVVALANAGPGTNGSQFFITYQDTELDPNYTPFALVVSGLDVVREVAAGGAENPGDGWPNRRIQLEHVR